MTKQGSPCIHMVTPLPPLPTGIAQYSHDLLSGIDGRWKILVTGESGSSPSPSWKTIDVANARSSRRTANTPSIYQIGNSGFHKIAMQQALTKPGIAVLHDTVLHHGRLSMMLGKRGGKRYRTLLHDLYGADGDRVAHDVALGRQIDLSAYPLIEDISAASRLIVVHSEIARERVLAVAPEATVRIVPMGIPLPALVDQRAARDALGIPQSAFVIASITHVNPNKRLPVVLRAVRMLRERIPEFRLIVAGTQAPGIDLLRQARAFGVEDRVTVLGYVTDDGARLLARTADACVNLRYPSAGETSASLLRLLGAGRPVLITNDRSNAEYPRDAVLPVDVGPWEAELVAEYLELLHRDSDLRLAVGEAARAFVTRAHGVEHMAAGYRDVVAEAYGIDLPSVDDIRCAESQPVVQRKMSVDLAATTEPSVIDNAVGAALSGLGLGHHDDTIASVSRSVLELGLHRLRHRREDEHLVTDETPIRKELLDIVACPACKTKVRLEGEELICDSCGRRYPIEDGIPIMLVDAAK
ncbi:MAG: glycosyltransferase [Thermomicrobiales bacterium]|nr:glycosyltransferase [Thermomicrobiales bacterium]